MRELPILRTQGVTKFFGGNAAVRNLTMELRRNRVTGLVGPNGAGKTTLLNVISGFMNPDAGEVWFESHRITGMAPYQISRLGIGRSFQDGRGFSRLSALENVLTAIPGQPGETVAEALFAPPKVAAVTRMNRQVALEHLEFVGLADLRHALACNLSYGQQKRLVFARLLANRSTLLLLDEPTAGLDPSAVETVVGLIRSMVSLGKTICLIEHNLDVVEALCDWVVFLNEGTVVTEGCPQEILDRTDLAEVYFGGARAVKEHR